MQATSIVAVYLTLGIGSGPNIELVFEKSLTLFSVHRFYCCSCCCWRVFGRKGCKTGKNSLRRRGDARSERRLGARRTRRGGYGICCTFFSGFLRLRTRFPSQRFGCNGCNGAITTHLEAYCCSGILLLFCCYCSTLQQCSRLNS